MKRFAMLGPIGAVALAAWLFTTYTPAQNPRTRRDFMRAKLDHSQKVLEGLALEDFELIAKGARELKALSLKSEWEPREIPNATDYISYTREFQRVADELGQKAKDRNIDGTALAYFRLTTCCMNCHKYVRTFSR